MQFPQKSGRHTLDGSKCLPLQREPHANNELGGMNTPEGKDSTNPFFTMSELWLHLLHNSCFYLLKISDYFLKIPSNKVLGGLDTNHTRILTPVKSFLFYSYISYEGYNWDWTMVPFSLHPLRISTEQLISHLIKNFGETIAISITWKFYFHKSINGTPRIFHQ